MGIGIINKEQKGNWKQLLIVQLIGLDVEAQKANVLYHCSLERSKKGEPNFVYLLHPGSGELELVQTWPMPFHQNENTKDFIVSGDPSEILPFSEQHRDSLLQRSWGQSFTEDDNNLFFTKAPNVFGGYDPLEERIRVELINPEDTEKFRLEFPKERIQDIPFRIYQVGPLPEEGIVMFCLRAQLNNQNYPFFYDESKENSFVEAGFGRIIPTLEYTVMPRMKFHTEVEKNFIKWLNQFKNGKLLDNSKVYCIVFLQNPSKKGINPENIDASFISHTVLGIDPRHALSYLADSIDYSIHVSAPKIVKSNK